MKILIFGGVIFLLVMLIFSISIIELYRIDVQRYEMEMNLYNERMIALYDDFFDYVRENNGTIEDFFNYTPSNPPADLSHVEGIL